MLSYTTHHAKCGGNRGASLITKAGLALAALMATLFLGNAASAQTGDYFRSDNLAPAYQTNGYDRGYNNDLQGNYFTDDDNGSFSNQNSRDNRGWLAPPRNDRPAYGDFQGDRYSPEPPRDSRNRDRFSLSSSGRRGRLGGGLNQNGRTDYQARRVPLPDLNDRGLNSNPYDFRDRDNSDPYAAPYAAPLPRDYTPPQQPLPNNRLSPNSSPWLDQRDYAPPRPAIHPADELSESEQIQQHLSARYGNPVIQRFIYNISPEQTLNAYRESMQLVDARALNPTSYEARTQRTAKNLIEGLRNREFLAANRISPSPAQVQTFETAMNQLLQSRPVQSQSDAVQMIYAMANLAYNDVGIRPTSVVMESIFGATETLDKYSTFLPEDPTRQPSASALDDSVVGIGVEIKPNDQGVEVVKALPGGPAQAAGLQAGDIITGINGQSIRGQNLNYAADLITGPAGSPISLNIVRNGRQQSPLNLVRREVKILSVSEVKMLGQRNDVGYIKLDKFAQNSSQEMDQALWKLYQSGMKSLVLDLRGNPGGLLTTAIELSNKFLPSGTIVSTRGRNAQDNTTETANSTQTWKVPLVVLVDGNSASASEIFAAAIQENGRGVIVGRHSYGKGTVQTHFPLRSITGNLKLTTAKFYSPKGREMAGAGVQPDVLVNNTAYRGAIGTAGTSDQDIQTAVQVAESGRAQNDLASTSQPARSFGR